MSTGTLELIEVDLESIEVMECDARDSCHAEPNWWAIPPCGHRSAWCDGCKTLWLREMNFPHAIAWCRPCGHGTTFRPSDVRWEVL